MKQNKAMSIPNAYSDEFYANGLPRRLRRAVELGWRYYVWDFPRYCLQRRRAGLNALDLQAALNPMMEFFSRKQRHVGPPAGYDAALGTLQAAGVRLTLPPARIVALLKCWESTREIQGQTIECGSFRGATALLLALLAKLQARSQQVLALDTFAGSPAGGAEDSLRRQAEYPLPADFVAVLRRQAETLGIAETIEIHPGLFSGTFRRLAERNLSFAFAHIDANLYQSTWEACEFVVPRMAPGGAIVFDDYHGPCDLGARLAIDRYLAPRKLRPVRLSGTSAWLRF